MQKRLPETSPSEVPLMAYKFIFPQRIKLFLKE